MFLMTCYLIMKATGISFLLHINIRTLHISLSIFHFVLVCMYVCVGGGGGVLFVLEASFCQIKDSSLIFSEL